ncbi:MAG TPA: acetyl-CoA carboxylase biotin carboxyl carrier protein [Pirellulales bacterium]|nr:acetyl-CoA carboxylase biotin carboxyl carrier protein [Pirellulales bacterium]
MANQQPNPGDIMDVKRLRRLVELMNEHDLGEIDLRDGGTRIRLRKRQEMVLGGYEVARAPAPAPAAAKPSAEAAPAAADDSKHQTIKSPMVGTFFASPNPESPAFVKVGDHVGPDTTVCIIEAMKVFNEIPAECSGKVVAVLVQNGAPVEFGQPLFKIDPEK